MKTIPLTQGKFTLMDDADYDWLKRWKWCAQKDKNTWYAVRTQYLGGGRKERKSKRIRMHREILKTPEGMETDHKDGNGLDNRRHNLRMATRVQNTHNRRKQKRTTSQYKGVSWCWDVAKWRSYIRVEGKRLHLGYFDSEIEAARAYDRAAIKYFGEFAHLNFSKENYHV